MTFPGLAKQPWPKEPGELDAFYSRPDGSAAWEAANTVEIVCPWHLTYGGKPVTDNAIRIHKKCAESLKRILNAIWDYYGRDQAKIDAVRLNEFDGSYNYRTNRNNPDRLSLHAYGAAVDFAAAENPNGTPWHDGGQMMPQPVIDAFLAEGWAWGGRFSGTPDPMHFQATYDPHAAGSSAGAAPTIINGATYPLLRKGSRGADVQHAQQLLGFDPQDGVFGSATETAVRSFQSARGLKLVDGRIGPETWPVLLANPAPVGSRKGPPQPLFEQKAPKIIRDLMADFGFADFHGAGVLGSIGQECGGFTLMQEAHPVGGGRGGYGWNQWTGPRRDAFFAWCQQQGLSPDSDEGNYGFLKHEMQTSEAATVAALKATTTLEAATISFERTFERAGIPNMPARQAYAARALAAYRASMAAPPVPAPAPQPAPAPAPSPAPNIIGPFVGAFLKALLEKLMTDAATAPADPAKPAAPASASPPALPIDPAQLAAIAAQYGPQILQLFQQAHAQPQPLPSGADLNRRLAQSFIAAYATWYGLAIPTAAQPAAPAKSTAGLIPGVLGVVASLLMAKAGVIGMPIGDGSTLTGLASVLGSGALATLGATGSIGNLFNSLIMTVAKRVPLPVR